MPVAHVMQPATVPFENLLLFGCSIRVIRSSRTVVGSPRAGRFPYDDVIAGEACEQLAASFSVSTRQLSMLLKMLDDRTLEDEALLRSA